ncbi:MAG: hypothetical protein LBI18_12755 [Planctomycetaceae bacterium]|jgi:hypothetical protein|nr:hypothetical protein [Planctomycetaceae bacterium]
MTSLSINQQQKNHLKTFFEIVGVFVVFYIFGAWAVPDSNEPYYIGKAIHFWNPNWIPHDNFLESKDSHWTFYVVFGWLSFFLSPHAMAWFGRFLTWGLLAFSWQRLSFTLVPVRWTAIPTALALAYYVDSFHAAGEWILGGVEGKSFAFPFVFLALESIIRGRWHRTWIFLGIASAFHILVGGWSVLVAGFVRFTCYQNINTPHPVKIPWGLFVGGLLSLFGLVPALLLDYGTSTEIIREARQIYVFDRLSHHLVPYQFPWTYLVRFVLLTVVWIVICRSNQHQNQRLKRFECFIWGTLILFLIGMAVAYGLQNNRILAAEILRFYWFRLSDVFVPAGIAIGVLRHFLVSVSKVPRLLNTALVPNKKSGYQFLSISGWLVLFGLAFCMYLCFDAAIFGKRIYFTNTVAEPAIPWALTLLLCWGLLVFAKRFSRNPTNFEPFQVCGLLGLYAAILFYAPFDALKTLGDARTSITYSRVEPGRPYIAYHWVDACHWIADPNNTPQTTKFWVPREGTTFKWHAQRSDVGTWKNIPQDAKGIVQWQKMIHDLFYYRNENGQLCDDRSLTILLWWKTDKEIEQLRLQYGFEYVLCAAYPELSHHKTFQVVYANELYKVYRISPLNTTNSKE